MVSVWHSKGTNFFYPVRRVLSVTKKQISVPDLMKHAEVRKVKRSALDDSFDPPPERTQLGAKRRSAIPDLQSQFR